MTHHVALKGDFHLDFCLQVQDVSEELIGVQTVSVPPSIMLDTSCNDSKWEIPMKAWVSHQIIGLSIPVLTLYKPFSH